MPTLLSDVRCWGQSGKHLLAASISPFDPEPDLAPTGVLTPNPANWRSLRYREAAIISISSSRFDEAICVGASSWHLLGLQRFGRSQRTRNSARYRSLGSSSHRKPRPRNHGSRLLFNASTNSVGSRVARLQLSIGGRRDAPSASLRSSPSS